MTVRSGDRGDLSNLESFRVGELPKLYYVPKFATPSEEPALLTEVQGSKAGWKQVSGRRLQSYGGQVSEKAGILLQVKLPRWLRFIMDRVELMAKDLGLQAPNHVLANAYAPGQGIMAHEDGPIYYSCACILSLGAPAVMHFHRKLPAGGHDRQPTASVALMPRSLLIFAEDAYCSCLHSIKAVAEDPVDARVVNLQQAGVQPGSCLERGSDRISLTIRRVLRVRKNLIRL